MEINTSKTHIKKTRVHVSQTIICIIIFIIIDENTLLKLGLKQSFHRYEEYKRDCSKISI